MGDWRWPLAFCRADGLICKAIDATELQPESRRYLLIDLLLMGR